MAQAKKKTKTKSTVKKTNKSTEKQIYKLKIVATAPFDEWTINLNKILQPTVTDPRDQLLLLPICKVSRNHPSDPGTPTASFVRLTEKEAEKVRNYLNTTGYVHSPGAYAPEGQKETFNPFEQDGPDGQVLSRWIRLQKWTKGEEAVPWFRYGDYMVKLRPVRHDEGRGNVVAADKFADIDEDDYEEEEFNQESEDTTIPDLDSLEEL